MKAWSPPLALGRNRLDASTRLPDDVVLDLTVFDDPGPGAAVATWQVHALCSQSDPEAFFPEKGGSTAAAKQVCGRCPVRDECLADALAHDERFGIWGGLSERERRQLKKQSANRREIAA